MNRIDRLTAILIQLQTKRTITAQEVAERFDISVRTVYRDIRALEEAGVPIGAEAGKGYFIMEGYHLPPVMFTKQEASAMLVGGKLLELQPDQSTREYFNNALLKVRSVLRFQEKDHIENLDDHVYILPQPQHKTTNIPNNFLSDIQGAIVGKFLVGFDYFSNYKGEYTNRVVEPSGLCYYSDQWHLIAFCRMRQDFRDFRLDRISKLIIKGEHFEKDRKEDFQRFVKSIMQGSPLLEVKVTLDKNVRRYISTQKFYYGFVGEEEVDNALIMTFMTPNLEYFGRWMLMYGTSMSVVSPPELKGVVRKLVEDLNKHHLAN